MYISTGWTSTGKWIVNTQTDGFDHKKDPRETLDKVVGRFGTFIAENLASHTGVIEAVNKKLEKLSERMYAKFQNLNEKCDFWSEPEDDQLRYDQHDPCKAAITLPKSLMKWSTNYNVHCKTGSTKFVDRVKRDVSKIQQKIQKKLKNC